MFICGLLCDVVWYVVCAALNVLLFVFVWCVCGRVCGGVWLVVADCVCACRLKHKYMRVCVLCGD